MVTQDAGQMWLLERGPKVATSVCSPLGLPMLLYQQDMGLGQRPGPARALAGTPVCPAGRMSHFPLCSGAVGKVPSLPAACHPSEAALFVLPTTVGRPW